MQWFLKTYGERVNGILQDIDDLRVAMTQEQELLAARSMEIQHAKETLNRALKAT